MKQALSIVFAAFFAVAASAQQAPEPLPEGLVQPAGSADLSQFAWKNRLLIVFAESENDPRFEEQMRLIEQRPGDLVERDVLVITDTAPAEAGPLRLKFRPRGFMLVLIGKDGNVYLRKPRPWKVREISRSIDKMPIRREEMRNR